MWFASGSSAFRAIPGADERAPRRPRAARPLGPAHGPARRWRQAGSARARVRLFQSGRRPIFVVSAASRLVALARPTSATRRCGRPSRARPSRRSRQAARTYAGLAAVARCGRRPVTVSGSDAYRPLYRIALNDRPEPSSTIGGDRRGCARYHAARARVELRGQCRALDLSDGACAAGRRSGNRRLQLSWLGVVTAAAAIALGSRASASASRPVSPFAGWHAWHHGSGSPAWPLC